jgi:hypothetical protein
VTIPKHPGSRLVDHPPNVGRIIRRIEAEIARVANKTRLETLTFVPAVPSRGEPATAAALADVLETLVYRSGTKLLADVACGTGAGSVMEARLSVPSLALTGPTVATASGGTERIIRIELTLPTAWESGAAHLTYVQARRVSGSDATTVRILRAWQR